MRRDTRGQSETIGATLLVGVVVVAVTTAGAFIIIDGSSSESVPLVDIDASADGSDLTLIHESGPSLAVDETVVIIEGGGNRKRAEMEPDEVTGSDGEFGFGDSFVRAHGVTGDDLRVLVIHTPSNAIITEQLVQIRSDTNPEGPQAAFDYTPTSPDSGEVVAFDAGASTDADGKVVSYAWDFDGDGTTDTTGEQVTHTYSSGGTYTASVTVTDNDGRTAMTAKTVTVSAANALPSASFTYSPSNPNTQKEVEFTATASDSDGSVQNYAWDFNGDGMINATGQMALTTYSDDGSKTVTLTITDDNGATTTVTETVQVDNVAPTAAFTYSPSTVHTAEEVTFDAGGSSDVDGDIESYEWDFADGTTATGESVTHSFDSPGRYDATLTITDGDGATATRTKTVEVGGLRYAEISNTFEGSKRNTDSLVTFYVQNNASSDMTVSDITVTTTGKADYIRSEEYEFDDYSGDADFYLVSSAIGYARRVVNGPSTESGYGTGERFELVYGFSDDGDDDNVKTYAQIGGGDFARAYFVEFVDRKQAGPNTNFKPVDMSGETVTVTFEFEYADGTSDTEKLDVQLPN